MSVAREEMKWMIVCDAGPTRSKKCVERAEIAGADAEPPDGWRSGDDPWGRLSMLTGEILVVHLCDKCAELQLPEEQIAA